MLWENSFDYPNFSTSMLTSEDKGHNAISSMNWCKRRFVLSWIFIFRVKTFWKKRRRGLGLKTSLGSANRGLIHPPFVSFKIFILTLSSHSQKYIYIFLLEYIFMRVIFLKQTYFIFKKVLNECWLFAWGYPSKDGRYPSCWNELPDCIAIVLH